jgi:hypothetical protein
MKEITNIKPAFLAGAILIASLFITNNVNAQESQGIILSGTVFAMDPDNGPESILVNADIILMNQANEVIQKIKANELGQYAFKLDGYTAYTIIAQLEGFQSQRVLIETLSANSLYTEHFDFRLYPATEDYHYESNLYIAQLASPQERKRPVVATEESAPARLEDFHFQIDQTARLEAVEPELELIEDELASGNASEPLDVTVDLMEEVAIAEENEQEQVIEEVAEQQEAEEVVVEEEVAEEVVVAADVVHSDIDLETDAPSEEIAKAKVRFTVQLGKFSHAINQSYFSSIKGVEVQKMGDFFLYSVGNLEDLESAQMLVKSIREKGFTDAFVRAFIDNRQVSIMEALAAIQ